jgi:hypothetical protein
LSGEDERFFVGCGEFDFLNAHGIREVFQFGRLHSPPGASPGEVPKGRAGSTPGASAAR